MIVEVTQATDAYSLGLESIDCLDLGVDIVVDGLEALVCRLKLSDDILVLQDVLVAGKVDLDGAENISFCARRPLFCYLGLSAHLSLLLLRLGICGLSVRIALAESLQGRDGL